MESNYIIKQKSHGTIDIDNREKDTILIWLVEKSTAVGGKKKESNVVIVERAKIKQLIDTLIAIDNGI